MTDFWLNVKRALRSHRRSPAYSVTTVLTLALGIGATAGMFAIMRTALWKPLPFRDPERLVLPKTCYYGQDNDWAPAPDFFDYREQADCFDTLAAMKHLGRIGATVSEAEYVNGALISPDFFQMLGIEPVAGRWPSGDEIVPGGPAVAVVSESYALRRFGSPQQAVGRRLAVARMNRSFPIVAVAPHSLDLFGRMDVWLPFRKGDVGSDDTRRDHSCFIYGRLKPGVSMESAQQQVDQVARRLEALYPDSNKGRGMHLNPLQEALMGSERPRLSMLMGAVALLLLIACSNVGGLMLAAGYSRRSELAVRASLGATRGRLVTQLLTESLLLALMAGILGTLLARFLDKALPVISGLAGLDLSEAGLDAPVLLFALGLSLMTGVLFGLVPALKGASKSLVNDLAPGRRSVSTKGASKLRGCMVMSQVALSLVLLIGSGMLARSLYRLYFAPLGFNTRHLLTGEIDLATAKYADPDERVRFFGELQDEIRAIPGVTAASFISHLPLRHPGSNLNVWTPHRPPDGHASLVNTPSANQRYVLPGYFATMGIPLLAGRDISSSDGTDSAKVMLISERMARTLFPDRNPLGQTVMIDMMNWMGEGPVACQVVGVVGNARVDSVSEESRATMYMPFSQFSRIPWMTRMCPAIRTELDPQSLVRTLSGLISATDRDVPLDPLVTMEERIGDRLQGRRATAATLALFSAAALGLASLGLYGVLSFIVKQRTREIGVRTALGARTGQVMWEVVRQGLLLALIGMGFGVLASLGIGRILESQLYQVPTVDPASIALAAMALTTAVLLASLIPAAQAARIDPVVALRNE